MRDQVLALERDQEQVQAQDDSLDHAKAPGGDLAGRYQDLV